MNLDGEIAYDAGVENPEGFGGFGANVNLPDSKRRGALVEYTRNLGQRWTLDANYTYTDAEIASGIYAGNELPFVAPHTGNLVLGYSPNEFGFYLDASYTGQRYRLSDEANSEGRLPSYILMNLNVILVDDDWELGLRVSNLTDKRYAGYQESWGGGFNVQYPQPGRAYEARLTYHF
jgi:iron complex outermembrane receptor protein